MQTKRNVPFRVCRKAARLVRGCARGNGWLAVPCGIAGPSQFAPARERQQILHCPPAPDSSRNSRPRARGNANPIEKENEWQRKAKSKKSNRSSRVSS